MLDDEEREDAMRMLQGASLLAQKYGPMIHDESEGPRQAITAMAIMMTSLSLACGVSMHNLMGVVMEVYRKTHEIANPEGYQ